VLTKSKISQYIDKVRFKVLPVVLILTVVFLIMTAIMLHRQQVALKG